MSSGVIYGRVELDVGAMAAMKLQGDAYEDGKLLTEADRRERMVCKAINLELRGLERELVAEAKRVLSVANLGSDSEEAA